MPRGTTHDCLAISGGGQEPRTISLSAKNPRGMLIGRTPDCAVPLESIRVSRRHARLFQDPFQRWIIEDLGSHNGLWVHGRRASIHAMTPGEPVSIGPFRVALTRPDGMPVLPDAGPTAAKGSVYNDDSTTVVTPAAGTPKPVPVLCMKQLNEIIDHMAALGSVALLYPEVCRLLAEREGAVAAILRLCPDEGAAPRANGVSGDPTVLAYRAADEDRHPGQEAGHCPRLSRRVLQAVRTGGLPVVASNVRQAPISLELTVTDPQTPRNVVCAPIARDQDALDVVYLDIPAGDEPAALLDFVRAVAHQVASACRNLQLSEARAQRSILDHQLDLARTIQTALMPKIDGPILGVDIALSYLPAMWVGGDYCDVWKADDRHLAFAIGDVCGKGLPAAMVMSNLHAALRTVTAFCPDPVAAMEHLNLHFRKTLPDGMFITLFLGLLEASSGNLRYVNAGHLVPITVNPAGAVCSLGPSLNAPLGVQEGVFTSGTASLERGNALILFTDGVTEAFSPQGESLSNEGVRALLGKLPIASAAQAVDSLVSSVKAFRGDCPQSDDMTVLALIPHPAEGL